MNYCCLVCGAFYSLENFYCKDVNCLNVEISGLDSLEKLNYDFAANLGDWKSSSVLCKRLIRNFEICYSVFDALPCGRERSVTTQCWLV